MIFETLPGVGSEQAGSIDICGSQHGNDLLLGDDELATVDEPEGCLLPDYSVLTYFSSFPVNIFRCD